MEPQHRIGTREQWLAASRALLAEEKAHMRAADELARKRRELPWVKVDKNYVFETPQGRKTLADLFDGRSQLIIYHFMLGPDWSEGCVGCSFELDHVDAIVVHLAQQDIGYVVVSRAPLAKIEAFKRRMGWRVKWVSSGANDFNYDFHVSFTPKEIANGEAYYNYAMRKIGIDEMSGRSVFYKDDNRDVFHTYSSYGRGGEDYLGTYRLIDIVPKGRTEAINGNLTDWVRHPDRYDTKAETAGTAG